MNSLTWSPKRGESPVLGTLSQAKRDGDILRRRTPGFVSVVVMNGGDEPGRRMFGVHVAIICLVILSDD